MEVASYTIAYGIPSNGAVYELVVVEASDSHNNRYELKNLISRVTYDILVCTK